ncbi:3-phosphoserine/phosphohydroxythreonine transaminase [Paraglaciecola arctica]|uniref:3-phosphoserine/phosphohydroxythreonine transaminase n=1 Tax=Paraglaciecola arctica TaxID=1128911 RepID=UPI001C07B903|nr:3-phosphoserine/phosphohydroxythreonine transaminase [Paraglaciecola arctica]MBU3005203.1 3-phosphoserine/phosphohydroxythreonine transaminase [Paraglaciecola arctica]
MTKTYNFCAGPAMLPEPVMRQAQAEFIDWQGMGRSVMEISHRSKEYIALAETAEQDLRDLMAVPDNYKVIFSQGGGRGQFAAVPMNLRQNGQCADFLLSGSWSKGAIQEAEKFLPTKVVAQLEARDGMHAVPNISANMMSADSAYFHYCSNETVDGIEINTIPDSGDVPLVVDMSSNILSQPVDVSKFGVIYAGAQKNIGPSGLAVVIVREDLLDFAMPQTPSFMHYKTMAEYDSMYNTPPTYSWYLAGLVFKWLKEQGGVSAIALENAKKAELLYRCIDNSDFYINKVHPNFRSKMNVTFHLPSPDLDAVFLEQAEQIGLTALKGHRSVGGMRASIYNAMPMAGVIALVEFMQEFARRNK